MWSSMDLDKSPPSPDEDFASDQNQRTSLHELTQRFVRLLQECEGGRLDLKEVRGSTTAHSTLTLPHCSNHLLLFPFGNR